MYNKENIINNINKSIPIEFVFNSITQPIELMIKDILREYLKFLDRESYYDQLFFSLRELLTNAEKANLKRIFFTLENIDPNNFQYNNVFKQNYLSNKTMMHQLLNEHTELYIRLVFELKNNTLFLSVYNNCILTAHEQQRIIKRISMVSKANSLDEIIPELADHEEGAGLGLAMMLMIIKNIGLDENDFFIGMNIYNETLVRLSIPMTSIHHFNKNAILELIKNKIEKILLKEEELKNYLYYLEYNNIKEFSKAVLENPPFCFYILHVMSKYNVNIDQSLEDAISQVGITTLKKHLNSFNIKDEKLVKPLLTNSIKNKNIHEVNLALIVKDLIAYFKLDHLNYHILYYSCLFSNIGNFFLTYISKKSMEELALYCKEKNINIRVLHDTIFKYNYYSLGADVLDSWEINSKISSIIRHIADPFKLEEPKKSMAIIIHIAIILKESYNKKDEKYYINPRYMKYLNIKNKDLNMFYSNISGIL